MLRLFRKLLALIVQAIRRVPQREALPHPFRQHFEFFRRAGNGIGSKKLALFRLRRFKIPLAAPDGLDYGTGHGKRSHNKGDTQGAARRRLRLLGVETKTWPLSCKRRSRCAP